MLVLTLVSAMDVIGTYYFCSSTYPYFLFKSLFLSMSSPPNFYILLMSWNCLS